MNFLTFQSVLVLAAIADQGSFKRVVSNEDGEGKERGPIPSPYSFTGSRFSGYKAGVPRYSSLQTALWSGVSVRGVEQYEARFNSSIFFDDNPPVCYSEDRILVGPGTPKSEPIGYFVCPYKDTDTIEDRYCCGTAKHQHCCKIWEDWGRVAGTIAAGAAAGLIILTITICILIKCCQSLSQDRQFKF